MSTLEHIGELHLRRLRAGELQGPEADRVRAHTDGCGHCRARLTRLDDEQRLFERTVPFEQFAAGVKRAGRTRSAPPAHPAFSPALGIAAAVLMMVGLPYLWLRPGDERPVNRTKGGAEVTLRIASPSGAQREASASAPEPLEPFERVRIGYRPGEHRWVLAVSVDEAGEVTALYPPQGRSLEVAHGDPPHYLPESLEFTGAGAERVIVILSESPLEVEAVAAAARRAFEGAGNQLARLGTLAVEGEQFHRTVLKP
jgi:hypothetical protein